MGKEQTDYTPGNYPQGVTIEWRPFIRSMSPFRAIKSVNRAMKRWWHKNEVPVEAPKPLILIKSVRTERRGNNIYTVYEPALEDAPNQKARLQHPGWKAAFRRHM